LSVLNQDYKDLKLSIFDNAFEDKTKDFVSSHSENNIRTKYHCHANNIAAIFITIIGQ
jgi:hypothetical protein